MKGRKSGIKRVTCNPILRVFTLLIISGFLLTGLSLLCGFDADKELASSSSKVTLCHKGKTIKVNRFSVSAHLGHGDSLGECAE